MKFTPEFSRGSAPRAWLARPAERWLSLLALTLGLVLTARAELQFDVFIGFDGIVPETRWMPITCEIYNDGPSFRALVEVTAGMGPGSQRQLVPVELPTNTRKRLSVPVFVAGGGYSVWSARLLTEKGKVRAEQNGLRARREVPREGFILGAMAGSQAGLPTLPDLPANRSQQQPAVARLQFEQFPDNPLLLDGLQAIYLSSEKALAMKSPQVSALHTWLHAGGHLIVGIESPTDVNSTPWLRELLPCSVGGTTPVKGNGELQSWLAARFAQGEYTNAPIRTNATPDLTKNPQKRPRRNNPSTPTVIKLPPVVPDSAFDTAELSVMATSLLDGRAEVSVGDRPLVIEARRGRGKISAITFSTERQPFTTWNHRGLFWARMIGLPDDCWSSRDYTRSYGQNLDGIFGALTETKQIRKLPLSWLLLILVAYLLVIGPVDRIMLNRLGKPMLTWITFPLYVAGFSLMVYYIGFKLRAGESELTEIHVVDVISRGDFGYLRGRSYCSLYSAVNKSYPFASEKTAFSTLRGELGASGNLTQGQRDSKVFQIGNNFSAEVMVPVWSSALFINDWLQTAPPPLSLKVTASGEGFLVDLDNRQDRRLKQNWVVLKGRVHDLGPLGPKEKKQVHLKQSDGESLRDFVSREMQSLVQAAQQRQTAFGNNNPTAMIDVPRSVCVTSFGGVVKDPGAQYNQRSPWMPGNDLSQQTESGDAVWLAWDEGHSFIPAVQQFATLRQQRSTMLRLATPINSK